MKRAALFGVAVATALVGSLAPSVRATPVAIQENVRHLANLPGTTGGHVAAEGNRLYMGNYGIGMSIYDATDPANPVQLGTYRPGRLVADAVPDAAHYPERKIAVLGGTPRGPGAQTTDFLDVTDPANPTLLHRFTGSADGESHNTDIVDERKLYLPSGGYGAQMLRIYDLSPLLQTPAAAPVNIFRGGPNTMWNTSPYNGKVTNSFGTGGAPTHVHDLHVYTDYNLLLLPGEWVDQDGDGTPDPTYDTRDIAFLAASQDYPTGSVAAPNSAVYIVDITDPRSPVIINKIRAANGHRYLHEVQLLESDPHLMFTSDEDLHNGCNAGGVYSWRLSEDLTRATHLDTWFNGVGTPAAVCSAHVFSSQGDYVFMGSYNAGLQVIDFTDPTDLVRGGQFIAEGANAWGATYHNGYVYTGDFGARGLDVYQFLAAPAAKKVLKVPNPATGEIPGVSEMVGECDPSSPADGLDGMAVPIPAANRGEGHVIRAVGTSEAGEYDIDVWFYDSSCQVLEEGNLTAVGTDVEGPIPAEAAFAYAVLYLGSPQMVYVQLDPPF